ncbi:hypothetical protein M8C13_33625 [Crossiella sp. SN42]|uniref:hypothetical protein n=1 Tax=Crossiella sp. SN42 TaxID=2944808 RepID=UPI00207D1B15|nr:hypothetical protein [Crossiella sp. SN42]MCO1580708.1 hypothetical protein [Crossiella sp. SN42]
MADLRVSVVSPGYVETEIVDTITNPRIRAKVEASRTEFVLPPAAIARAVAFAIGQRLVSGRRCRLRGQGSGASGSRWPCWS